MQKYEAQKNDKGHKLQIPKTLLCRKPISCYSINSWSSLDPEPLLYSYERNYFKYKDLPLIFHKITYLYKTK